MPNFGSSLRLNRHPVIGLVPEVSGTAPNPPGGPTVGQLWTDTSVTPNVTRMWNGTAWQQLNNLAVGTTPGTVAAGDDSRFTDQRTPSDNSVTSAKIVDGTIVADDINAAHKDGAAGVFSLRTLGTGAQQAVAGNDTRLNDQRVPTDGSVTDVKVAATAAIAESKLNLATDAAAGTGSRRTLSITSTTAAMPGGTTLNAIATANAMTADLAMNSRKIVNLGAPTNGTDAARLQDVQNATAGIDLKPSVRAASVPTGGTNSTGNIAIATGLVSGTVLDGVTLATGDRVLLKNQATASENGSYVVPASGAAARTTDAIGPNTLWLVEEGTTNKDTSWMVTTDAPITVGTTALTLAQFGAPGSVSGTANRITVGSGNVVDIASTYVGQPSITTVGTISNAQAVWNGTAVAIGFGGTGAADAAQARANLAVPKRGYADDVPAVTAGSALSITHSLNTTDVIAQVRDKASGEYIYLDIVITGANTLTITSGSAYAAGALRIVVLPVL